MFQRARALIGAGLAAAIVFTTALTATAQTPDLNLQAKVDAALEDYNLVGLGAAVITADMDEPLVVVAGERRNRSGDMIKTTDAWHIGSNTKMMTALTYATLVARGEAEWGATLPDLFPHLAETMHQDWQGVTIEDLLAHRSGLAPNLGRMAMLSRMFDDRPLQEQCAELAQNTLTEPAAGQKGGFAYSNLGYTLAGTAIIPLITQDLDLVEPVNFEWVFNHMFADDLKEIDGRIGFGPPKAGIEGHMKAMFGRRLNPVGDSSKSDNPAIFGPAGTMHIDLRTHALFLAKHFITGDAAIKTKLLTPYPDTTSDYALGWGIAEMDGIGKVFGHSGSNTMWLSNVTYAPSLDAIVIVNVNQFNADARNAVRDLSREILSEIAAQTPN